MTVLAENRPLMGSLPEPLELHNRIGDLLRELELTS
jgi:hypothetical protein